MWPYASDLFVHGKGAGPSTVNGRVYQSSYFASGLQGTQSRRTKSLLYRLWLQIRQHSRGIKEWKWMEAHNPCYLQPMVYINQNIKFMDYRPADNGALLCLECHLLFKMNFDATTSRSTYLMKNDALWHNGCIHSCWETLYTKMVVLFNFVVNMKLKLMPGGDWEHCCITQPHQFSWRIMAFLPFA